MKTVTLSSSENMTKIAIKILRGSAVTQNSLVGQLYTLPFANLP